MSAWALQVDERATEWATARGELESAGPAVFEAAVRAAAAAGFTTHVVDVTKQKLVTIKAAGEDEDYTMPDPRFDGVSHLSLAANFISSIDSNALAVFGSLTTLDLAANSLEEIPMLSGLSLLTTLNLSCNRLGPWLAAEAEMAAERLRALPALATLSFRQCSLTELPTPVLSGCGSLTSLSLVCNNIAAVPVLPDSVAATLLTFLAAYNPFASEPGAADALTAALPRCTQLRIA
ncbi:uncharacterized protein AMSG_00354 [Thecamonas trahens ATCC 50062]|uniref:Uncharacterized protein n=1 Tax=Thecamonas trahens ATCC 50062 TaxID=461836 RepID=A0A0L0D898_THETB|nr:hypothetical protein AMSG_00354 [Thecamonas trahens ATCC 50062]KNC48577.1 hypothetical protein AMSG_00354 [Thecamonas trahens ATCC 50062]|eukprot:XP_013762633.1 hypothetical protein AMSG_00354 [Thecamonas trahens ATCC 50062]